MAVSKAIATAKRKITEEEFVRLPDDGRKYELVDGEAKEVPTGFEHDAIGAIIVAMLMPHAKGQGFVTIAQAGFRMADGNIRCPDVSYTRKERLPEGKPPKGFADLAPDLAIEIISPNEDSADVFRKLGEYFASGSQQVWVLEPETQKLTVYRSLMDARTLGPEDELSAGDLLPTFQVQVAELFAIE
jgi:Uma2 family endonuclease